LPKDQQLPQLAPHANTVLGAIDFVLSGAPYAGEIYRGMIVRRIRESRDILINAIRHRGISEVSSLTEAQKDFILPASYRFLEQVRLGEYEHNLKVLASIIAGEIDPSTIEPDVGKLARAARRLEMLPSDCLVAISLFDKAISHYNARTQNEGLFCAIDLKEVLHNAELNYEIGKVRGMIDELAWRGIIVQQQGFWIDGPDSTSYAPTYAYSEIILAAKSI
jgi:hypothetical protein